MGGAPRDGWRAFSKVGSGSLPLPFARGWAGDGSCFTGAEPEAKAVSLEPERRPIYPVFVWLEITEQLTTAGDGAFRVGMQQAMNGRRWGADAPFDVADDERAWGRVVLVGSLSCG